MVVKRKPKPLFFIVLLVFIGIISIGVGMFTVYLTNPVDKANDSTINVVIPSGTTTRKIATILKENDLIKSEWYFSIYVKLHSHSILKASTYKLSKSMSMIDIVKYLEKGTPPDALVLTFKEGERITDYAKEIATKTNYSVQDVLQKMQDRTYISTLISNYWFLSNSILNNNIYYPLEGYLSPDTYFFDKDVSIEEIVKTLLDEEENKLEKYKNVLENKNIHEIITMASIVEIEGTNTENRKQIVGIFNNRLANRMNLGSDVTTYYALQQPLSIDLNTEQFAVINPYNTRATNMGGKLPVGPICNPTFSSIEASIYPSFNDYLYFVADKHGNIFYTKTLQEHEQKVAEIKAKGDWIW